MWSARVLLEKVMVLNDNQDLFSSGLSTVLLEEALVNDETVVCGRR